MTADEIAFGEKFRSIYANLIKNGSSQDLETFTDTQGKFNVLDIASDITATYPSKFVCTLFDQLDAYGMI